MDDHCVILLKQLRSDDDVCDSGFVFHTQEDKSFCCAGTLANNHGSDYFDRLAIGKMFQAARGRNAKCIQLSAMLGERMGTHGQAGSAKIRKSAVFGSHWV